MTPPYRDRRWRMVRRYVLERDAYRCQLRLPKCRGTATEADHIIDWRDGGPPLDPSNLRASCKACNVAQRNTRIAAKARANRTKTSRDW